MVVANGVLIVPLMPADDVVTLAIEAERIGYDYCFVADEGFHPDVYVCLGAIARETDRIRIGPVTNGYTRHPAVTAAALATLNQMSGGRAVGVLLVGGAMVLAPMGIARKEPYRVVEDSLTVLHRLLAGESVTWQGHRYGLDQARLGLPPQEVPIWVGGRGPLVLALAGRKADGAVVTVKPDLPAALKIVDEGAAQAGRTPPSRIYITRICYTPELLAGQRRTLSFVLMDSPRRVWESLGLTDHEMALIEEAVRTNQPSIVDPIVTDGLLARYQVTGSPDECAATLAGLIGEHRLDVVLADVLSADLEDNRRLMADTFDIFTVARSSTLR